MNLRPQRRECPRFINLTSLIDVVFNLLLFFMVTTSFTHKTEIKLDLPSATSGQATHEESSIEVSVDAKGRYALIGSHGEAQPLANQSLATVRTALQTAADALKANGTQDPSVVIDADGLAPHQSVVTVMDAARQVGLVHLTFATRQAAATAAPP